MDRYFIIYKPYKMVSQFISPDNVNLLGDLDFDFPEGTHAIGRLDNNSEGLLILTTNKKVTRLLFQSEVPHLRTYLVQVEKVVSPEALHKLRSGISIRITGDEYYTTANCEIDIVKKPDNLPPREHEFRADLPQTWLRMTLTEGKFHQIRKMVSSVYHDCKRLIRISIEGLELGDMQPGQVREIEEEEFFRLLKIEEYQ
ncbi:MAG: pseudouridine synthase [Sphingobacteriaceae bacterium]|nr:pseudouridine synthase [Sphingobacteriaceae bacterium]MBK7818813.1 pseudouridine synthase [Sphingobacteriaceae bacterium]